jgi:hypothetical protein
MKGLEKVLTHVSSIVAKKNAKADKYLQWLPVLKW